MVLSRVFAAASVAAIAAASPLQLQARQYGTGNATACAQVASSVAAQGATPTPSVDAQLAYNCITSVPLHKDAALHLLAGVVPYFKWQSSTAWLEDPPEEYEEKIQPAIDVWGGLEEIKAKVESEEYANEFEFGFALYTLLQSTHDGHFVYIPDVVGTVFNWARPVPLVSVSADGKELPKPYVYADVLAESFGNVSFTPSAVTKIDGEDALEYLEAWSQRGSLQDRDALYNNVFYELATVSLGPTGSGIGTFAGSGRGKWVYPGPETKLEFENGTTVTYTNVARVLVSMEGVTDGESLYQTYFSGSQGTSTVEESPANSTTPTPSASATPSATSIPAPGYPPAVYKEQHNLIGGYFLEDDYSDIAVLSVPSFVSLTSAEVDFQQVTEKFLVAAKAAGKTKLVIDVQANGGGTILQGYDLYKQLFPRGIGHAAFDRFRAFESTQLLSEYQSRFADTLPRQLIDPDVNETLYDLEGDIIASPFNYKSDLNASDENFPSWQAKFGPHERHGDKFSSLFHWNLSDVLTPYNSGGIYVHGYAELANYTSAPQPFANEDIVVVTDGYCASTCTIFSELMRQRQGVKYISLGGRAKEGITQAVGGIKGTNNYPWTYIQYLTQLTITNLTTSEDEVAKLNATELGDYWDNVVFERQAPGTSMNVNFRDGIRDTDESETPLQFVYEPADCRILYTKAMTVDVTAIWKAVADSAFGGKSHCVAGSLGGYNTRSAKRELSAEDRRLSKRMHAWRRELRPEQYPLDVYTDLKGLDLDRQGIMWP
ncbi:hypothetical protein BU23DRAFT_505297 [Bimuria novae-zelandiae CBS 107.79]|uniref:Uncharacterized protein n=1 Tax=Bimuria novae-zelandiae CBS 107.79 TaxID=1447943 RepID=A0A6A5VBY1_9PLEO|nr:hypothetical protein BU23DRAFT_505297 [Bimuria novae-zelandiae CBS 107.79]